MDVAGAAGGRSPIYRRVAEDLRQAILRGDYASGARLPAEDELAERYGVSRGTVRQALGVLRADGLVTSRRGTRRVVLGPSRLQSFEELRSFTRWARSLGEEPGGRVVRVEHATADEAEAHHLRLPEGASVHRVLRLRTLSGRPVMVERTTYPERVGAIVAALPKGAVSHSEPLEEHGVIFADADHTIDVVVADADDAKLLGCAVGDPLLREWRCTTDPGGTPVEWSQDRYLPGTVAFTVHNSTATTALGRQLDRRPRTAG
ncbi:GntR family transcriptional regulator [Wenjunlia tyrosinilytica]|uniref:GntR family transcriptional regulator n=1 Tax=Wenjunlia tyrosinilytica TaxID=1544741 RepID=A0A918E069_9ACTN|nr:GntR family transcriptional regulator [Wenjunlia tyrosinilytica]GGO97621.1 GntR family transcriptional regulator [Wenjunlia tyrosinilytica]